MASHPSQQRTGVCNLCEAICGLRLTVEDGRVTSLRGDADDPLSRGHVCPKAFALMDVHDDPDRLRRPVRRTAGGWEEIDWDAAVDLVAERLGATIRDHGEDAVAVYLGNPNVHSLGAMTHGTALVKALGTRNRYSATSVDQLPHQLVAHLMYGHQLLLPVPDLDRTDFFLVVGGNPMASNGSLMTVPDFPNRVRELKARGGSMVVLDPRRTETARVATAHHFVRPGTDAAVLLAMLHTLFAEDLAVVAPYVDGADSVREAVRPFTPERAEAVSGVPADVTRQLARDLAAADAGVAYGRVGVSTQRFGVVCQWAIQCLNLFTGNLDRPGGAMLTRPAVDLVGRRLVGRGHLGRYRSRVRGLPEFAGELPVATLTDEILTPGEGQVRALVSVAGNPVSSTPDGSRLSEALRGLDFMVAIDFYVNETTRHADVILPPATALERDHYDLVFHTLAVRNTARFTPAVLEPAPDARQDWQIFRDLALRVARSRRLRWRERLALEARMRLSPRRTVDLLLRTGHARLSVRALLGRPSGVDLGPLEPCLPQRLQTPDKRIDAAPGPVLADLARVESELLDRHARPDSAAGELLLIGRRHLRDCNSWLHNTQRLTRGRPRHRLLMHPDDLAARGLQDGAAVRVTSAAGSVEVEVEAGDDVMPGVVSLPHGYGHAREGVLLGHASGLPGASVNDLTDPGVVEGVSGNAVLSGVPVTVTGVARTAAAVAPTRHQVGDTPPDPPMQ